MFTGIIEEVGRLKSIFPQGEHAMQLTFSAQQVLEGAKTGDSIAVNGVCLTVVGELTVHSFQADVMPETMKRTNLGALQPGSPVNLERAMTPQSRFGGHMVSGHVDGTGVIRKIQPFENATFFEIAASEDLLRYMVLKGSVAVDGISLTLVDVREEGFAVSIIPHTLAETTLQYRKTGEQVNLEVDMVAKYVERFVAPLNAQQKHVSSD